MSLASGSKLLHYEVVAPIGAGAMGEVWRAKDTKLGREVAIKVLPEHFADDEERLRRFEREAKTLATLNHPNVAQIHGVDQVGDTCFLVLELVPGESLEERLRRGALPVREAIDVCRQIAEGLEAAHEAGVIHRDLKPANVRLTPEGKVKVLDFGLAKPARDGHEGSTTDSVLSTEAGRLLGTPTYMAPEQARGKPIDRRVDVWAFGCVLYECLTARRAFAGETLTDVFAAVLERVPDWTKLPPETPSRVRELLERCFAKDPRQRLRDIGEARLALESPDRPGTVAASGKRTMSPAVWVAITLVTVVASSVAGVLVTRSLQREPETPTGQPVGFEFSVPGETIQRASMAVSPDGTRIAFVVERSDGKGELRVRSLRDPVARAVQGTSGARQPFWSPDGKEIGYFDGPVLKRVGLDGSSPRAVGEVVNAVGGTWAPDGTILCGNDTGPIRRIPAAGGRTAVPVTVPIKDLEANHVWPQFLPDGRRFLYSSDGSSDAAHRVLVGSLDGDPPVLLLEGWRSQPVLDPRGAVLASRGGQLFAFALDLDDPHPLAEPRLVADRVYAGGVAHEIPVTASAAGVLVYQEGGDENSVEQVDHTGRTLRTLAPAAQQVDPAVSPDGSHLATEITGENGDSQIWILDLQRGVSSMFTERGMNADSAVWAADGKRLYYDADSGSGWNLCRRSTEGNAAAESFGRPEKSSNMWTLGVSRDERRALIASNLEFRDALFLRDLTVPDGGWTLWHHADSSVAVAYASLSPDERWVAYSSSQSGEPEVYLAPLEGGPAKLCRKISSGGGREPRWSPDGRKLYYRSGGNRLMEVSFAVEGDGFEAGVPVELFPLDPLWSVNLRNTFDVMPDGESFAVLHAEVMRSNTIHVRTEWHW